VNFKVFSIGPCAILHLSTEDAHCLHVRGGDHVIFKCTSLITLDSQIIPKLTELDPLYLGIGVIWFVWQRRVHFMHHVLLNDFLRWEEEEAFVVKQMVQSRTN